jgi:hypothetical protein
MYNESLDDEEEEKCEDFYSEYKEDDEQRMREIMKNIIRNNGEFQI